MFTMQDEERIWEGGRGGPALQMQTGEFKRFVEKGWEREKQDRNLSGERGEGEKESWVRVIDGEKKRDKDLDIGRERQANREKTRWYIARGWYKKGNGRDWRRKARKKLGDGKEERASSEYLMGSGGVYWSARQRRPFHLVIQLFSHLVDVVSPCEGSGRTLRPPMQSRRVALENMKVAAPLENQGAARGCRLENGRL